MEQKTKNIMGKITIYEKLTCTKCRQTLKLLKEAGVSFREIQYYNTPISHEKFKELLKKLNMEASEIMRTGEKIYKELDLKNKDLNEDKLIDIMIKYPDLIQRPIVEKGDKAILGRPPEKVKELL